MLDRPVMMVYQQMALLPNISMQSVTPEHIYLHTYKKRCFCLGYHLYKSSTFAKQAHYSVMENIWSRYDIQSDNSSFMQH